MPPKMLTRMAFTFSSRRISLKASFDLLLVGAAAGVQEVGRLTTADLDHVEGRHGEPAPFTMQPMSPSSPT